MNVSDVLRQLDEDSDNDFDGYVDEVMELEEDVGSEEEDSDESSEPSDTPIVPIYTEKSGCTSDMTSKSPSDFFHLHLWVMKLLLHHAQQFRLTIKVSCEVVGLSTFLRAWAEEVPLAHYDDAVDPLPIT